jgi:hypothetical protein
MHTTVGATRLSSDRECHSRRADVDPVNTSNFNYWSGYLRPRHDRYRSLPYNQLVDYAIIPSSAAGTSNSNGYVRGVTSDSAANVTVSTPSGMAWFYPGWNDPVPELKFR